MIFVLISNNKEWFKREIDVITTVQKLTNCLFESFDLLTDDKELIWNSILSHDFFAEKKLIIINNYFKNKDFDDLIQNWNYLQKDKILVIKTNSKKNFSVNNDSIIKIIDNSNLSFKNDLALFLKNNKIKVNNNVYDFILKNNFEIINIKNEFLKWKHMDVITINDIKEKFNIEITENLFSLIEALWKLKYNNLLDIYINNIENNYKPRQIFGLIKNHFITIYLIKNLQTLNYFETDISRLLDIHKYRLKKLMLKSKLINYIKLNKILKIILKYQIKINDFEDDIMNIKILIFDIYAAIV